MIKTKTITFLKDDAGWYADVKGKSRANNAMVLGADKLCEAMSGGSTSVTVTFSYDDGDGKPTNKDLLPNESDYLLKLRRIEHDPFGATYWLSGKMRKSFGVPAIWLCNVTEFFLGCDHPRTMFILDIKT